MASGTGKFISSLVSVTLDLGPRDDDTTDRLNHYVMYGWLIFLAALTGSHQFVGSPIKCWIPAEYKEKFQEHYANSYCWVNSLYNIPFDGSIPADEEKRYSTHVNYYRWVTVMFIVLAFLFRVPQLLWVELKHTSGVNVEKLIRMTLETTPMDQERREKQLGHVADFFHRWVTSRVRPRQYGRKECLQQIMENTLLCYGKRSGHHLAFIYIFIKLLYLLNTMGQFFIISSFLNTDYWRFGYHVWTTYHQHGEWQNDDIFPRIALCDMKVRQMQNLQTYTFQCVLTANLFLEKMFLLVWFLLLFVLIANVISFFKWKRRLLFEVQTIQFLKNFSRHLLPELAPSVEDTRFVETLAKHLRPDGVFVLRMISVNTTDMLTIDLIKHIWLRYKKVLDQTTQSNGDFRVSKYM